ncbi:putative secreted protein [Nocardia nova SH22a]|uniref:Putative secreted protein n=1 Tax=Nocardia nova SH22a TaxID=1415166 RepID=W5TSN6_9NOCA|nr:hypothetical protein [Nocardia nova]AHH20241.1 putative secreted protein [Nocardia nova SH22a]
MTRPDPRRLLTGLRPIRIPLILLVLYLVLHPVLAALSARHGFGSPDGPGLAYLAVGAAVVGLRLLLLIVVPAVIAYRIAVWVVLRRRPGAATEPDA